MQKTKLMLRIEKEQQRPLERLLPEMVNEYGQVETARRLNVSRTTLYNWLFDIQHIRS